MRILALDLGTTTGWCIGTGTDNFQVGMETWAKPSQVAKWKKVRQDRRCDFRVVLFFEWLRSQLRLGAIDKVVFEDVQFIRSTYQGQLWPSFRTAVWLAFPHQSIECVPTGALKKFATGDGGAGKGGMVEAMRRTNPSRFTVDNTLKKKHVIKDRKTPLTDDAVDAFWLYQWARKHIKL